jgi:hypothetical protein
LQPSKISSTGGRGADAELVFLLADGEAGCSLLNQEGGDALIALGEVGVRDDDEEVGFDRVGDPEFLAGEVVVIALVRRLAGEGKGVGAGAGLGERVGPHPLRGQLREVLRLLRLGAPAQQRVVEEGVLDIDEHGHRGVDLGQFLNHQHGHEEGGGGPAEALGDLDAHEAQFEAGVDEIAGHLRLGVHLRNQRTDLLVGEALDRFLEEFLVFGEVGEGKRSVIGHGAVVCSPVSVVNRPGRASGRGPAREGELSQMCRFGPREAHLIP